MLTQRALTPSLFLCALFLCALLLPASLIAQGIAFQLTGGQTVPRFSTSAYGSCAGALLLESPTADLQPPLLSISCSHTVDDATAAHIHVGAAGQSGPILFPFADPTEIEGIFELSLGDVALLINEGLYVNVHSPASPPGEIRGQIRVQNAVSADTFSIVPLAGDQVVPPVTTTASGSCLINVEDPDADETDILVVCEHDVADPTAAHIHIGDRGTNGPVLLPLNDGTSPIVSGGTVGRDFLDAFASGDLYFQVHSMTNPPGEIRGQIDGCVESTQALCMQKNRFQAEVTWRDFQGNTGSGTAVRQSLDSGTFWFFSPDNTEMLVKVLDSCALAGFNSYWVFYAATTDVEFTLTVTDTQSGEQQVYTNPLGVAAPAVTDTSAFATCP